MADFSLDQQSFLEFAEKFYGKSEAQLHQDFLQWSAGKKLTRVFTPNPEQIMLALRQPEFAQELQQGDIFLPDGQQLVNTLKRLHKQKYIKNNIEQRLTGIDLLEWWLDQAARLQTKTFLLGGFDSVAKSLAQSVDPSTSWCWGSDGYNSIKNPQPSEEAALQSQLEGFQPKVIFVGYGAPWQEKWVNAHADWLEAQGVGAVVVVGGALDVLSPAHRLKRAPKIAQKLGIEWAFRLAQEPGRWQRQFEVIKFLQKMKQWFP